MKFEGARAQNFVEQILFFLGGGVFRVTGGCEKNLVQI
jgi:hypothetical protein